MQASLHTYTCTAIRDGYRWRVRCDDHPRVETMVRLLANAAREQRQVLASITGVPEERISVTVHPVLPDAVTEHLTRARQLRREAARANHAAARERRAAARALAAEKLSLRDIGTILGVSYQRAYQLIRS